MSESAAELLTELRNGTLWITFNRPQARNALTFGMYKSLPDYRRHPRRLYRRRGSDCRCL